MTGITILTAIALIWGGLIVGLVIGRNVPEEQDDVSLEKSLRRAKFRSPLVKYE